ncbi:hypothetical protein PG984_001128 [Apiospora sp. TS-2023a]
MLKGNSFLTPPDIADFRGKGLDVSEDKTNPSRVQNRVSAMWAVDSLDSGLWARKSTHSTASSSPPSSHGLVVAAAAAAAAVITVESQCDHGFLLAHNHSLPDVAAAMFCVLTYMIDLTDLGGICEESGLSNLKLRLAKRSPARTASGPMHVRIRTGVSVYS